MDFLDTYPLGCNGICEKDECNIIAGLFGELIRNGHFSHQRYLQRLIARGDVLHDQRKTERSKRHLKYVKYFPLFNAELHHLNQRRVILYNINCDDTSDEDEYESMVTKIKDKLPYMFSRTDDELDRPRVDDP
ncbi:3159_t:CDS:2, partial [Cetraspora pellucida]